MVVYTTPTTPTTSNVTQKGTLVTGAKKVISVHEYEEKEVACGLIA